MFISKPKIRMIVIVGIVLFSTLAFLLSGCSFGNLADALRETNTHLEEAVNSIDRAIGTLSQESANWQIAMYDLEREVSEDLQSTLRTEVHNLTQSAIMAASSELRCNSEYIRIRLRNDLIRLRNNLASQINNMAHLGSNGPIPLLPEPEYLPFVCDASPAKIDLNLAPERRTQIDIYGFDFKANPIKVDITHYGIFVLNNNISIMPNGRLQLNSFNRVEIDKTHNLVRKNNQTIWKNVTFLYHKDVTRALSIISDFHAVLDLSKIADELTPNASEIILSSGDKIISEIPIITHQTVLTCNTYTQTLDVGKQTIIPSKTGGGDSDFDGNGPRISLIIELFITPNKKNLKAWIKMGAYECDKNGNKKSDYTEAVGSETITLYPAQDNEKLVGFDVQKRFHDDFIYNDSEHKKLIKSYAGTAPVSQITYTGDTKGDDIGKTKAEILFRKIKLQIEKCELR